VIRSIIVIVRIFCKSLMMMRRYIDKFRLYEWERSITDSWKNEMKWK